LNQIKVNRNLQDGHYRLEDIFENLKSVEILLKVFKSKENLDDVFEKTVVIVDGSSHYMHVKNEDASIVVGKDHLKNSEKKILYLDIIHELVHVKQQRQGLDLYDSSYDYVDRPTEVEAYEIAVEEARKLGMNDSEIFDYLHVEWISPDEHKRLASRVGVKI
jgi:predicted nucleotidyltransferase